MVVRRRAEAGYTLVALVIGMAVLTILLAAVGPLLSTIMKRDREEELIFRGRQYARAIQAFQKRYGRFPNTLKEMMDNRPRTIRKLWKDPMCRCDNWKLLILGSPDAVPFSAGGPPGQPQAGQPGAPMVPPTPTPSAFSSFGQPNQAPANGPIVGVRSKVHEEGLRQWRGYKYYDEWSFIAGDADNEIPGAAVGSQPKPLPGPLLPTPPPSNFN